MKIKKLHPIYVLFLTLFFVLAGSLQVRAQLPDDFEKVELALGLENAVSFKFVPDGRIFIISRYGEILIHKPATQGTVSAGVLPVFYEYRDEDDKLVELEDGLIGIAIDPDFENNNKIYLHYSPVDFVGNRVSRFSVNGDAIDFSSEEMLLEWPTTRTALYHSAGDMEFDSQGNLLIATGDNTTYPNLYAPLEENRIDYSAEKSSANTDDFRGKILRIKPVLGGTYTIPPGNLFQNPAQGRPEIYVMGARNPYRFHVDTQNNDWLFWGDVGPDASVSEVRGPEGYDEINLTKESGNYGWPYFAGTNNEPYQITYANPKYYNNPAAPENISTWNTGATVLPPAQPAWIQKTSQCYLAGFRYNYDSNLSDNTRIPQEFDDMFFYYDMNTSRIWAVEMDGEGNFLSEEQLAPSVFSDRGDGYIDMEVGPDGKMYILSYGAGCCPNNVSGGKLIRIDYNGPISNSCIQTPFPDSWTVHPLEENPYTAVYTFADDDLDGDGLKDIVTGGWWYKNPGSASGNWERKTIGGAFGNVAHVYDFDGDGDLDLLGTTGTYVGVDMVWAQNDGQGNFTIFNNIPSGDDSFPEAFLAGLAGGVFDEGGPYQMAINWNGAESTNSPVDMLTPSEDPTTGMWTLVPLSPDSSGEDIQAGDIDQDGDLDLFQGINWLRNNGSGNFETFDTGIRYPSTPDRAQLADFDDDGDLDAVVGQLGLGATGDIYEFAWFAAPADPTQPWVKNVLDADVRGSLSVFAIDIDFDGDKDIVVGEWLGQHRLIAFENDLCGSGQFNKKILDNGALGFEHHDGARVVDIDNDGDYDVISNGWRNDLIPRIYENTSAPIAVDQPIVDAGEDRNVVLETAFTLTGSANDPDGGDIVSYLWTVQTAPNGSTATLVGANTTELTVNNATEGVYVFRLSATDDEGDIGFDDVTVTVGEGSPGGGGDVIRINTGGPGYTFEGTTWAADQFSNGGKIFSKDIAIANTNNDQLYQTERYRDDGSGILIYEFPVANGEHSVNLHFAEIYYGLPGAGSGGGAGSRVFNIDVENQGQRENYDIFVAAGGAAMAVVETFTGINVTDQSLTITMTPISEFPKISGIEVIPPITFTDPTADAGPDQTITLPENSVVLPGSGADADGGAVSYLWTQQSGPEGAILSGPETAELSVSEMVPGTYVFRLTVTDDEGESDFDEVSVRVSVLVVPDGDILAVAEAAPTMGSAPLEVSFTGSNSVGENLTYLWNFKDGKSSTEADPTNVFIGEGTYNVELTVTDTGGITNTSSITIAVGGTDGDLVGIFLDQNPPRDGIAILHVMNQPGNFMMLGINVYDIHGRLLNSYNPEDIVVNGTTYQVPVHILKAGLYFFEIDMNQGEPVTLKVLVGN